MEDDGYLARLTTFYQEQSQRPTGQATDHRWPVRPKHPICSGAKRWTATTAAAALRRYADWMDADGQVIAVYDYAEIVRPETAVRPNCAYLVAVVLRTPGKPTDSYLRWFLVGPRDLAADANAIAAFIGGRENLHACDEPLIRVTWTPGPPVWSPAPMQRCVPFLSLLHVPERMRTNCILAGETDPDAHCWCFLRGQIVTINKHPANPQGLLQYLRTMPTIPNDAEEINDWLITLIAWRVRDWIHHKQRACYASSTGADDVAASEWRTQEEE